MLSLSFTGHWLHVHVTDKEVKLSGEYFCQSTGVIGRQGAPGVQGPRGPEGPQGQKGEKGRVSFLQLLLCTQYFFSISLLCS